MEKISEKPKSPSAVVFKGIMANFKFFIAILDKMSYHIIEILF